MYRISSGFEGVYIMRIGTVDDFALHEGKLKPRVEQFTKVSEVVFSFCFLLFVSLGPDEESGDDLCADELCLQDRVRWFHGGEGVEQVEGNYYTGGKEWKSQHEKL